MARAGLPPTAVGVANSASLQESWTRHGYRGRAALTLPEALVSPGAASDILNLSLVRLLSDSQTTHR